MTWDEIDAAKLLGHTWTYAWVVVNYRPRKGDPNQIRIAVGGNLITYQGDSSTRMADLTMSKLLWNSVLSHQGGQIYVPWSEESLSNSRLGLFLVHEDPLSPIPRMDQKTVQFGCTCLQRIRRLRNLASSVGTSPDRYFGQQTSA
jgi:hypothetical protein